MSSYVKYVQAMLNMEARMVCGNVLFCCEKSHLT